MKWKKDEAQNSEIETLVGEVRSAASEKHGGSMERFFMEVGDLDMVRAMERALLLMVSHSDYAGAMKVLEGHLRPGGDRAVGGFHRLSAVPLRWHRCSWRNFWRGVRDFIFDAGMEDVLAFLTARASDP